MKHKQRIAKALSLLKNPQQGFERIEKSSLEEALEDYMKLLLTSGVLAGVASFIYQLIFVVYLFLVKDLKIDFFKLANYSLGTSAGIFFLYLFAGTVGISLVTFIVKILAPKVKYIKIVKVVLASTVPFLLFGWLHVSFSAALFVWCIFLLVTGLSELKKAKK